MNKWQMSKAAGTMKWDAAGGHGVDGERGSHYSIHPRGRKDSHRMKQRQRRHQSAADRHQGRRSADISKGMS